MGLFDSIIGTASEEAEPLDMGTIVEDTATPIVGDLGLTGTTAGTTSGTGDPATGTGTGTGDPATGTGTGTGDPTATVIATEATNNSIVITQDSTPIIDIGGDIGSEFFQASPVETTPVETAVVPEVSPIVSTPESEVSPIAFASESIVNSEASNDNSVLSEGLMSGFGIDLGSDEPQVATPSHSGVNEPGTLDTKITDFVSTLEELKTEDDILLQKKEAEISELKKETNLLEKEVKKIEAEEKKIAATISSLTEKTK